MSDIAQGLYIKYGLQHSPTDEEVRRWRNETKRLINLGCQRSPKTDPLLA